MKKRNPKAKLNRETEERFVITNLTKGNPAPAGLPFRSMKDAVLGKRYRLSLVFVPRGTMRRLNNGYRKENKPTDILSFPLGKTSGEIFICPIIALREAGKFRRDFKNFAGFLFIHGLAHLKGWKHGSRMETLERKFRKKFGV